MDSNLVQKVVGNHINKAILWARDDTRQLIIFLLCSTFISIVVLPALIDIIRNFDYLGLIYAFSTFIYVNSNTRVFITALFIAVILLTLVCIRFTLNSSRRVFEINIEKQPELWSYYKNSGWSIVEDAESWNKVLKLTHSSYPTILKCGNDWLNYNFFFEAKVPSNVPQHEQNFSFVVRARDKGNNVFFQCRPDGTITPHFLTNGLFLVDKNNRIKFQAEYPLDKWIQVKVNVKGDEVKITMLGVSAVYKIPSVPLVIPSDKLKPTIDLSDAINWTQINTDTKGGPDNSKVSNLAFDLDYEKGTVGFREHGNEIALFRKIKIELLEPIYK